MSAAPIRTIREVSKFGRNTAVGITEVAIASGVTVANYQQASAATAPVVVSTNTADNGGAATGALTVRIYGLDENWQYQSEDATLNGLTEVNLAKDWFRVFRMEVLTVGSGGVNAGDISVKHATGGNVMATIKAGDNQTLMAMFTVPEGHIAEALSMIVQLEGGPAQTMVARLWMQENGTDKQAKLVKQVISLDGDANSHIHRHFDIPLRNIPPRTDIWITGIASAASQTANAMFDLKLFS